MNTGLMTDIVIVSLNICKTILGFGMRSFWSCKDKQNVVFTLKNTHMQELRAERGRLLCIIVIKTDLKYYLAVKKLK